MFQHFRFVGNLLEFLDQFIRQQVIFKTELLLALAFIPVLRALTRKMAEFLALMAFLRSLPNIGLADNMHFAKMLLFNNRLFD